ncbi:Flp pilus assembly protein CpaB [Streptantibioticus ferralitis]|uniref:Flp pilus assembly protein CpaB n=1 Tax=Streptantibioticus ferralitis TaxID=236510 RepID=A0ABT5ZCF8_9ACTN|nr:Flp pilus assembly protein CpaB [Streptantibioticus ferralitis]MDF2261373.1 Flp pilus assembly protein CpaB [Streptantibioticus ferralitis]
MNSRQRRGVILLVLSALCAFAAFFGVLSLVNDVDSKVGPEVSAYELKQDVSAYTRLSADQFDKVSMPQRWLPPTAVTDLASIDGKVAAAGLAKGSLLQRDMVSDQPQLKSGEQEIAIMVDAATGVAGEIHAGNTVNIFATFPANGQNQRAESRIIVSGARVLKMGSQTPINQTSDQSDARRTTQAVPITFALNTEDAQRVAYAEAFATHVRLALVAPGSDTSIPSADRTYTLEGDK